MYLITWRTDGNDKSLKVHTSRAMLEVVKTLERDCYKNREIRASYVAPRRVREIVISFEN